MQRVGMLQSGPQPPPSCRNRSSPHAAPAPLIKGAHKVRHTPPNYCMQPCHPELPQAHCHAACQLACGPCVWWSCGRPALPGHGSRSSWAVPARSACMQSTAQLSAGSSCAVSARSACTRAQLITAQHRTAQLRTSPNCLTPTSTDPGPPPPPPAPSPLHSTLPRCLMHI